MMFGRNFIYALCLLVLLTCQLNAYNVSLVNSAGNITNLAYDFPSKSYIDTNTNPNIYVRACGIDTNGKYAALAYNGGVNATLVISQITGLLGTAIIIPAKTGDCVNIDLDVSSFRGVFPGQPDLVISNDSFVSQDDAFYAIDTLNGTLAGEYFSNVTIGAQNIVINISAIGTLVGCAQNYTITQSKKLIVACAHGALGEKSCVLASPNSTITIPLNGMSYSYYTLNAKLPPLTCIACPTGTNRCLDGTCQELCCGIGTSKCTDGTCKSVCCPEGIPICAGNTCGTPYCACIPDENNSVVETCRCDITPACSAPNKCCTDGTCQETCCPTGTMLCSNGTCLAKCCAPGELQCADGSCGAYCACIPDNNNSVVASCYCGASNTLCQPTDMCCTDGSCQATCPCPEGTAICEDGTCQASCCATGTTMCEDGTCQTTCCANGTSLCSNGLCQATCCAVGSMLCADGSCGDPYCACIANNSVSVTDTCKCGINNTLCDAPNRCCTDGSCQEFCPCIENDTEPVALTCTCGTSNSACAAPNRCCTGGLCGDPYCACPINETAPVISTCKCGTNSTGCVAPNSCCGDGSCQELCPCPQNLTRCPEDRMCKEVCDCPAGLTKCQDGFCRSSCGGNEPPQTMRADAQVNCTGELVIITMRNNAGMLFSPSSVKVINPQNQQESLQRKSTGIYEFTPGASGNYILSATNPGYNNLEEGFIVNTCTVPVCKENDISCSANYDCCSGFCNSFGVCSAIIANDTEIDPETGEVKPPLEKQITIGIDASCKDREGTINIDPKDSKVEVFRIDGSNEFGQEVTQGIAGFTFTPKIEGRYEARASKTGYLKSKLPFTVLDCTEVPKCTDNGLTCASDNECCSAYCNQASKICEQRVSLAQCIEKNGACKNTGECCVGACISGKCSVCSAPLSLCRVSADCCEGYCSSNKCVLPAVSTTTIINTLADKEKSQSLWPVVVGLAAIAAYAGATTGFKLIPPAVFAVPIIIGFITVPFLGILAALLEIIIEKTKVLDWFTKRGGKQIEKPNKKKPIA